MPSEAKCWDMPIWRWEQERFADHCYFYPSRDCPGWAAGFQCGRIGDLIPEDAKPDA